MILKTILERSDVPEDLRKELARYIAERKWTEDALKKRERQLAESQRIAHIGSWEHNLTTGEVLWSDELFRLLGLDPQKDPADFSVFFDKIHPDDQPALKQAIEETVSTGKHFSIDYRFLPGDGTTRILHAQAELKHDETGTQTILSGTGQDITERKKAEDAIRESEIKFRSLFNSVNDSIMIHDFEGNFLEVNDVVCELLGYRKEELYRMSPKDIDTPEAARRVPENLANILQKGVHQFESEQLTKDGRRIPVDISSRLVDFEGGKAIVSVCRDITERKRLEQEHLRIQKLESLGVLAAGIAHDFNNLLTGIKGNISLVPLEDAPKVREKLLEEANNATDRAASLTGKLLTFSSGGAPNKALGSLSRIIRDSAEFSLGKNSLSSCRIDLPDDLWHAEMDSGQIGQVIQNLAINARQAMPEGGVIRIRAENLELPASNIHSLEAGMYVRISVSDTGIGIPEKNIGKIFDPYFTTKERDGGGSGLGLAVVHTVIKNHAGAITVESKQGEGTTFHIFLPASRKVGVKEITAKKSAAVSRSLKILVMDDEAMIRNILKKMLAPRHQVELTENGQAALDAYALALEAKEPFDLVILDLTIPGGMGGVETLKKLREVDPDVTAIISSGYSDASPEGFKGVLPKPYDKTGLESLITKIFQSKPSPRGLQPSRRSQ